MAHIDVLCPECGFRGRAPEAAAARWARCPKCGAAFVVPAAQLPVAAMPPPTAVRADAPPVRAQRPVAATVAGTAASTPLTHVPEKIHRYIAEKIEALASDNKKGYLEAISELGRIGSEAKAAVPLLQQKYDTNSKPIPRDAFEPSGFLDDPQDWRSQEEIDELWRQANTEREVIAPKLKESLARIGPITAEDVPAIFKVLLAARNRQNLSAWESALKALHSLGPAAVQVIPTILDQYKEWMLRDDAKGLLPLDQRHCISLMEAIIRSGAAIVLQVLPTLDPLTKILAAGAIALDGAATTFPILAEATANSQLPKPFRQFAAGRLTHGKAPSAVPALLRALADTDDEFRRAAIPALTSILPEAEESIVPALLPLLKDPVYWVREVAAIELAKALPAAEKSIVPALLPLLQDESRKIRVAVAIGLAKTERAKELREKILCILDKDFSRESVEALLALGPDALPTLVRALYSPSAPHVVAGFVKLGRGAEPAAPAVVELLLWEALGEWDWWAKTHAVACLQLLGPAAQAGVSVVSKMLQAAEEVLKNPGKRRLDERLYDRAKEFHDKATQFLSSIQAAADADRPE